MRDFTGRVQVEAVRIERAKENTSLCFDDVFKTKLRKRMLFSSLALHMLLLLLMGCSRRKRER
jgi:hypothetical protein